MLRVVSVCVSVCVYVHVCLCTCLSCWMFSDLSFCPVSMETVIAFEKKTFTIISLSIFIFFMSLLLWYFS